MLVRVYRCPFRRRHRDHRRQCVQSAAAMCPAPSSATASRSAPASTCGSCKLNAKIGIPSGAIIARVDPSADVNVISAGSNDPDNPALARKPRAHPRARQPRDLDSAGRTERARDRSRSGGPARRSDRVVHAVARPGPPAVGECAGPRHRRRDCAIGRSHDRAAVSEPLLARDVRADERDPQHVGRAGRAERHARHDDHALAGARRSRP